MKPVTLTVPVNPVPASRPRVPRSKFAKPYYAGPYANFKDHAPDAIRAAYSGVPLKGPLDVSIRVVLERPKTTKLDMPKPDWDNFAKAVCDAGNTILWEDDAQIRMGLLIKQWAEPGEPGRIDMHITRADLSIGEQIWGGLRNLFRRWHGRRE